MASNLGAGKRPGAADGGDSEKKPRNSPAVVGGNGDDMDELLAMEQEMAAGDLDVYEDDDAEMAPAPVVPTTVSSGDDAGEVDESMRAGWRRPPVGDRFLPHAEALSFQWMDVDLLTGDPLAAHPRGGGMGVPGATVGPVPIIRFFGVTDTGNSVTCFVHGFTPYLYCILPRGSNASVPALEATMRSTLNRLLAGRGRGVEEKKCVNPVLGVQVHADKNSLMGYNIDQEPRVFLQVFVAMPTMVPTLKRVLEDDGVEFPAGTLPHGLTHAACPTFESNVPFVLRYMIDSSINGSTWLELPQGTYSRRTSQHMVTHTQIEVDVVYSDVVSHEPKGIWSKLAPLRVLSFDIECQGRQGHFPDAQHDPVIQISSVVQVQGEKVPAVQIVFTLKGCLPIVGAQVVASETEDELLLKWRDFVQATDCDLWTGYNIQNFDTPYLLNRAKTLEKKCPRLKKFSELGRVRGVGARMTEASFSSAAYGNRDSINTTVDGRVQFDLLPYMFRNHKLSSYSLNSVSAEFLGQQKEDVHHSIIADLQNGTDADRHRLAVYCLKDSLLPIRLMDKLAILVNYVEMARVTGVPIDFLLTRGQQIKVFSMLLRKCRLVNLLIPTLAKHGADDSTYEGATVIEPKKAFYNEPIATLDFASLYPSIIQGYNLCYSTLVAPSDKAKLPESSYQISPSEDCFVNSTTRKGILPQILDEILAARKQAKRDMKNATDPMEKAVQNGRQLALKVSANSVYGFTGATVGQLPCLAIASSTTSYGRQLLMRTKDYVQTHFTLENGYPANADVVYGDTDSVMIKFGAATVAETMPLAEKAAAEVSSIFPDPVKLEFEKVYWPYLLMNKKRYAGLLWTNSDKYDYMDCKGLETVRRDNCLLVRQMVDTCLRKILIERNVEGAIGHAKSTISDLLQNKLDISLLVVTKSLAKSADDDGYKAKQAHVELAMRMRKRDPGTAPNMGDRVPYVIIQAGKGVPAYEKSEDPVYVLENSIPIDVEYYLHNQLSKPLLRIFEPIIDNPQSLLSGDHTRTICKPTPTARKGGIMMFAVKTLSCLGCKCPITDAEATLCARCKPKEAEIFMGKSFRVREIESSFGRLWTECQRCAGSQHHDVLCSNCDCPIFYKRKKVQKDLADAHDALSRFGW